ncbi:MAG: hypothetical protein IPK19_23170 [Chloroflexi bacterium]|nr:hypothetical protein [Chloroflexota bacterium]
MAARALRIGDLDMMVLLARDSAYLQLDDGRLATWRAPCRHRPAANGEPSCAPPRSPATWRLPRRRSAWPVHHLRDAPHSEGVVYHAPRPELWIDSMYMAPPFLAIMGYCDEAVFPDRWAGGGISGTPTASFDCASGMTAPSAGKARFQGRGQWLGGGGYGTGDRRAGGSIPTTGRG